MNIIKHLYKIVLYIYLFVPVVPAVFILLIDGFGQGIMGGTNSVAARAGAWILLIYTLLRLLVIILLFKRHRYSLRLLYAILIIDMGWVVWHALDNGLGLAYGLQSLVFMSAYTSSFLGDKLYFPGPLLFLIASAWLRKELSPAPGIKNFK